MVRIKSHQLNHQTTPEHIICDERVGILETIFPLICELALRRSTESAQNEPEVCDEMVKAHVLSLIQNAL
jgi:hypothetical protein